MNPLTNVKNIAKLSETELRLGLTGKSSWHSMYNHSAWIFVGGLNFELTEGDIICVFSQYGEITEINLVKDKESGKSKGFCFICYEDQRSTILAVDNLNGIKLVGRTIRVDHCGNYETPEEREKKRQKERQKRDNERGSKRDTKSKDEIEIKIEVKRDVERDSRRDTRYMRDFRRESEKDRKYSMETRDTRDTRTGTEYQERDRRRNTKYSERDRRRDGQKKGGREKH